MKFPMIETQYGYREMTEEEYETTLAWYKKKLGGTPTSRRDKEYLSYLTCWFSDKRCDGLDSYNMRYNLRRLPMSLNVYFG